MSRRRKASADSPAGRPSTTVARLRPRAAARAIKAAAKAVPAAPDFPLDPEFLRDSYGIHRIRGDDRPLAARCDRALHRGSRADDADRRLLPTGRRISLRRRASRRSLPRRPAQVAAARQLRRAPHPGEAGLRRRRASSRCRRTGASGRRRGSGRPTTSSTSRSCSTSNGGITRRRACAASPAARADGRVRRAAVARLCLAVEFHPRPTPRCSSARCAQGGMNLLRGHCNFVEDWERALGGKRRSGTERVPGRARRRGDARQGRFSQPPDRADPVRAGDDDRCGPSRF